LALALFVGIAVALALAPTERTTYTATTTSFVSMAGRTPDSDPFAGSQFVLQRMTTYAGLATSADVLGPVIADLHLNLTPASLAHSVTSTGTPDSVLLAVTVTDADARRAVTIADAIAKQQAMVVEASEAPDGLSSASPVRVTVVDPARAVPASVVPPVMAGLGKAGVAALLVLLGAALVRRYRRAQAAPAPSLGSRPWRGVLEDLPDDLQIGLPKRDTSDLGVTSDGDRSWTQVT
jgi:capsular polysaccharide biosynthesis protein